MPAVEEIIETEQERVERWRADELMRAGFDPASALELAARFDIDIRTPDFWRSSLDVLRADIDRFEARIAATS